jgi:hypothetical protein
MRIWRAVVLNGSLRPLRRSKDGQIPRRNESVGVNGVKCTPSVVWVATQEDEARIAYEKGIRQAEKYGHGGMADELRAALVSLGK